MNFFLKGQNWVLNFFRGKDVNIPAKNATKKKGILAWNHLNKCIPDMTVFGLFARKNWLVPNRVNKNPCKHKHQHRAIKRSHSLFPYWIPNTQPLKNFQKLKTSCISLKTLLQQQPPARKAIDGSHFQGLLEKQVEDALSVWNASTTLPSNNES